MMRKGLESLHSFLKINRALGIGVVVVAGMGAPGAAGQTFADVLAEAGEEFKVVGEVIAPRENSLTYLYCESPIRQDRAVSGYIQFFRQQKFWQAPFFLHVEFRSFVAKGFDARNIYMAGGSWTFVNTSRGNAALEILYRNEGFSNYQITLAANWELGRWSYGGYADFFGPDKLYAFSENKFFFSVAGPFSVGANLELGLHTVGNHEFSCRPFGVVKFAF